MYEEWRLLFHIALGLSTRDASSLSLFLPSTSSSSFAPYCQRPPNVKRGTQPEALTPSNVPTRPVAPETSPPRLESQPELKAFSPQRGRTGAWIGVQNEQHLLQLRRRKWYITGVESSNKASDQRSSTIQPYAPSSHISQRTRHTMG